MASCKTGSLVEVMKFFNRHGSVKPPKGWKYRSSTDLVLALGRLWSTSASEIVVPKGRDKECFGNAARLAWDDSALTYVEGFALAMGIPMAHAWVVDDFGRVIETTWREKGIEYLGVAFRTKYLSRVVCTKKTFGLIPEIPEKKFNPYRDGYPAGALVKRKEGV